MLNKSSTIAALPVTHGSDRHFGVGGCPSFGRRRCRGVPVAHRCRERSALRLVRRFFSTALCSVLGSVLVAGTAYGSPPGASITNQASLEYLKVSGESGNVLSNEVSVNTAVIRSPAALEFSRVVGAGGRYQETVGPSACLQAGAFVNLGDPVLLGGTTIDPSLSHDVNASNAYNIGEVAFLRLVDSDQNRDYLLVENAVVDVSNSSGADAERIQLTETGPDTGVFAGFLPLSSGAPVSGDCLLQGAPNSAISAHYIDPADAGDTAQATAQLDPTQRVFESRTGSVISGTTIEIIDASSGLPASVYGNDGISQFPSAIISGGTATDSSGTSYVFGPGEYRFPVVPDGDYRLRVTPPAAYGAPSSVAIDVLQNLGDSPWLLSPASFGDVFTKAGDVSIAIDIPIDPQSSTLFLQKRTLTTTAAPGDFVRYEITLENTAASTLATNVVIQDHLPFGVRFVAGSVMIDGVAASDPFVSENLNELRFDVPILGVGSSTRIFYVVEIVAGKRDDKLINSATAFAAGGLISNQASAEIRLTEDLFRSNGTIIGRVLDADCDQDTFAEDQGVENIRIYLEDGRYAVTDAGGRFHFEGVETGTHVAQLDTFTVPPYFDIIGCPEAPEFSAQNDSQFVRMSRGSLKRADFYLRRKQPPHGRIDIEMRNFETQSTETVAYEVILSGVGNVDIENTRLMVVLPQGVSYQSDSLELDGASIGEPQLVGPSVSTTLPQQSGNWTSVISFVAVIEDFVEGELITKALAKFDTPMETRQETPVVETRILRAPAVVENKAYVLDLKFDTLSDALSYQDMRQLDRLILDWQDVNNVRLSVVGHSDSQSISPRNRHLYADNYALSEARATAAAIYVAAQLGMTSDHVEVIGRGADIPVADNTTAAGRQANRRVEMAVTGVRPMRASILKVTQESSGTREIATTGAVPGMEKVRARPSPDDQLGMPASQTEPLIESLSAGYAILLPEKGYAPAIASTKIAIQHRPGQSVELTINGRAVSKLNLDSSTTNSAGTIAVTRWAGVDLVDGENRIRAVIWNADASKAKGISRTIHYTGTPIRAELVAELSTLVADGKANPVIALRLFDRTGKPSRAGMVGRFRIEAPYRSAWDESNDRRNALVEIGERSASYRVDADGIVYLELAPTTQTGEVTVVLPFENYREQEIRAWLRPALRDWILVGFSEGTVGYNTLSDNIAAAEAAGYEAQVYDEGRAAFFAKGSIKGEYLLTVAYDSARSREKSRDRFNTVVDPNAYYSLYADTAEQRFEAASQRKIYVKLERSQFYALFGDFETGLSVTDLARYQRRFNGFKSEYRGQNIGYTAFAAESDQSFNRDEIRGDGTSGLYQLSTVPIIANSEKIRIEVRDRFDSGIVLSSQNLTAFLDYSLDTLNGSLYFKKPVPNRDLDFNPVYIVVEYESVSETADDVIVGGRASMQSDDSSVEIGVSHIDDGSQGATADLTGVDLRWQINEQTLLKAERAQSGSIVGGVAQSGTASSIDIEHNGEKVDVRAFAREIEEGYGLGYQSAADKGIRRLGIDVRAKVGERLVFEGEGGWQQNLATDAIRNVARANIRYQRENFTARLGVSHAQDKFDDGQKLSSDLAEVGLSQTVLNGALRLRVGGSVALDEEAQSADHPARLLLGADYRVFDGVDLIAEYEQASGSDIESSMSRVGVRATPWSRAQINSFLSQETSEFGPRLFANIGLVQGFQVSEKWVVDVGVDHTETLLDTGARSFDPDRELPFGSHNDDFMAAYVGAMYSAELWSANSRLEVRDSDAEDRLTLLAGWYREPLAGHGLSAGLTVFRSENPGGGELSQASLKVGWAYRQADRVWSFLNRVDLTTERLKMALLDQDSWRLVNNFNANRRFSAATQLSLQYAFKYVRSTFDNESYSGYTDLIGVDLRRGFAERFDVGLNSSVYHSYNAKVVDYGFGVDVGYNIGRSMWLTLGYNFSGFDDEDFAAARYTASGPYLRFAIKADQHLLKRIAGRR